MKRSTKILLGVGTFWPFLYLPIFLAFVFSMIFTSNRGGPPSDTLPYMMLAIFPLHFLTILVGLGLSVFYIVNVFRNQRVEKDRQVMWVLLLFMVGMFAQPVYWYLYIWRDEPQLQTGERAALGSAGTYDWTNQASMGTREKEYVPPAEPPNWRD